MIRLLTAVVVLLCPWIHAALDPETAERTIATYAYKTYYDGHEPGHIPGLWGNSTHALTTSADGPIFFYISGIAWNILIDYWTITGDATFNNAIAQGLSFQTGDNLDFQPANQTLRLGNDEIGFWGLAAMTAAEHDLPLNHRSPQWHVFAQNVFDVLAARWDVQMCGGGIRWQIKPENPGYEYKDSRTQGTFFQLAIRLARYTGNATYGQWAEKTFQWMSESGLLTAEGRVYDGLTVEGGSVQDCSLYGTQSESKYVWSVNNGLFLSGSALMYKITNDQKWADRTNHILNDATIFANFNATGAAIITEVICEPQDICHEQRIYKGVFARELGVAMNAMPSTRSTLQPLLDNTAHAILQTCSGGDGGQSCGGTWYSGEYDGETNLLTELNALSVLLARRQNGATVTQATSSDGGRRGGSSTGSSSASTGTSGGGTDNAASSVGGVKLAVLVSALLSTVVLLVL